LVITTVLAVAASSFGMKYKAGKDKAQKLLSDVIIAVQDDTVSDEECQRIAADAKSFLDK
jgi:hypothetical protein